MPKKSLYAIKRLPIEKFALITFLSFILIIIGCSNEKTTTYKYLFTGENEQWSAEYKIDGSKTFYEIDGKTHYNGDSSTILTVTYKNDISELSTIKNLVILYETSSRRGRMEQEFSDGPPKQKTFKMQSGGSGSSIDKDEIVKLSISIDGVTETIDLINTH